MEENKSTVILSSSLLTPSLYEEAIVCKSLDNIITDWNNSATHLLGFSADEVIGKSIFTIIPEGKHQEERQITSLIENGINVNSFYTLRLDNGNRARRVMLSVAPVLNAEDEIIGVCETFHDISHHHLAEEKQGLLAAIVDSSEDAIISKTLDGIIRSWNSGAEKIFGYKECEIVGKSIMQIIPKGREHEEISIIEKIRKGEVVSHFESIRLTKDNKEVALSITVSPIKNSKGEIIGASKIARDISEKLSANSKLQDYTRQLEKLNAYKDDFIGLASHELKTPLTSISANLQILERKLDDGLNKVFVSKTLKHVNKLTNLIGELLDVAKIQSGKLMLSLTKFNIQDVIDEVLENVQMVSPTHKIQLLEDCNVEVLADRQRIDQVLINLLNNAIKYSPDADKVWVRCFRRGKDLVCSVQDFGIGIPKNMLEDVFSQFFRVESIVPVFPGLGIGLFISNDIVKRHKGRMWAESEVGKGSTFYFSLPLTN